MNWPIVLNDHLLTDSTSRLKPCRPACCNQPIGQNEGRLDIKRSNHPRRFDQNAPLESSNLERVRS